MASLGPGSRPPLGHGGRGGHDDRTRTPYGTDSLTLQEASRGHPPPLRTPDRQPRRFAQRGPLAISSTSAQPVARPGPGPSKIPQTTSVPILTAPAQRRPSDPRQSPQKPQKPQKSQSRPPLTHQSQSWATQIASPGATRSSPNALSPSATTPRYPRSGSGSSVQTLATKSSGVRSRNNSAGTGSSSSVMRSQTPLDMDRGLTESPVDFRAARKADVSSAHAVVVYPELDRYRGIDVSPATSDGYGPPHPDILFRLATESLPAPPTPYYSGTNSLASGMSGSPSTRFSESPGAGPYSRDTTPTSISSHSPGLAATGRMIPAPRMRQTVRGRAGSFGKDAMSGNGAASSAAPAQTLSAIRESLNSSSSSSNGTVRGGGARKEKIKKKRLSPTPPSPPPRKSSQKFKKSGDGNKEGAQAESAQPALPAPSNYPAASPNVSTKAEVPLPLAAAAGSSQRHQAMRPPPARQQPMPPARPSRDGTPDLLQLGFPVPVIQSNLTHAPSPEHFDGQSRVLYNHRRPGSPSYSQSVQPKETVRSPTRQTVGTTQAQTTHAAESRTVSSSPGPTLSSRAESRQAQAPAQAPSTNKPGRAARTPSPNVSTFRTRFPLFGRRTKTAPTENSAPAPDRKEATTRRGPAAGTGHEGYGRLAGRRRSSSVSTFLRSTTGSSQESLSSPQFQDPFLRDRLSPVVIAGGEVIENQNTGYDLSQTTSNTSTSASATAGLGTLAVPHYRRPSTDSQSSREDRLSLWPSAIPRGSRLDSPFGSQGRRPSDSSDSEAVMRSTLAYRRSVHRLQSPDRAQVRVPRPIVVRPALQGDGVPAPMTSMDMSVMSDDSSMQGAAGVRPDTGRGRKGSAAENEKQPSMPKKLTKRARSPRKWNLFGRSHSQPATAKKALQSTSTVAVTIEAAAVPPEKGKSVAFYAMIDSSEQEDGDGDMDVEDVLREARVLGSPTMPPFKSSRERRPSIEQTVFGPDGPSRLLPGAQMQQPGATLQPSPTSQPPQLSQKTQQQQQQYHPELQPPVQQRQQTSRQPSQQRDTERPRQPEQHRPKQGQQQQQQQQPKYQLALSSEGPVVREVDLNPVESAIPKSTLPPVPTNTRQGRPSRLPQVGRIPKVVSARPEQTSPKSFSRPFNRVSLQLPLSIGPLLASLDASSVAKGPTPPKSVTPELIPDGSTATGNSVDPPPQRRFRLSQNVSLDAEYIGRGQEFFSLMPRKDSQTTSCTSSSGLLSFADATAVVPDPSAPLAEDEIWDEYNDLLGDESAKAPVSAGSSQGMPFYLEISSKKAGLALPDAVMASAVKMDKTNAIPLESPTIVVDLRPQRSLGDAPAKTGRPPVASSIYSVSSPIKEANAADQRDSTLSQPPPTPFSVTDFVSGYGDRNNSGIKAKKQPPSPRNSGSSQLSNRSKARVSDSSVYSQVSEDNSPISQVNLRVGSMTVSKWLTFGHVLFSPARDDMVKAVSPPNGHSVLVIDGLGNDDWSFYAAETYPAATFFNLSPRAPLPANHQSGASAFPLSPPNHHQVQYKSHADKLPFGPELFTTVVFRFPGAAPESYYRNIVNEARRVLKPGGYLELSILDLDLNNMGPRTRRAVRRLKEQIHGHTPDMHLGSAADAILRLLGQRGFSDIKSCRVGIPVASPISQRHSGSHGGGPKPNSKPQKDQRSLAEMISDESPVADESITSMVARVGRWWHSRCYGDAAVESSQRQAPNATKSNDMWMDRALLGECEEWRTNLKLTVCYARVPDIKRVASI